ncbi:MAG: von Willebrand factor type A domain-containing protein, partial [Bacteroidales bacterium]|nr:von Willebrand factor type A domain-containing protein [Bacteroidales bacterium]
FSVYADGASFCIMRRYLANKWPVNPDMVRIEEFLNYFTFDYPDPTDGNAVAINGEMGACPWNAEHKLLRLGIKGKPLAKEETPKANFVFLVDVSGSMDSFDKLELLKSGLLELLPSLDPDDRISIVTYSGEVKLLLESTPVKNITKIQEAIKSLNADGATNGGDAIRMAYREISSNYIPGGNNRIILGTDGDFNVGTTNDRELVKLVEEGAAKGIYLTALGFGSGNLNDAMMEKISNAGNGTYEYIDSEKQMMKVFVHERGKFNSVAADSKCQVTFNPAAVASYRLIGYENRMLNAEDFDDDKKDAGEIGAGQTITALYEIIPAEGFVPGSDVNIATFDFRYKPALNEESIPLKLEIGSQLSESENIRFASGVAAFGLAMRDSKYRGTATVTMARNLVGESLTFDPNGYRKAFLELMAAIK